MLKDNVARGVIKHHFVANLLLNVTAKEFWKSLIVCCSYDRNFMAYFFGPPCIHAQSKTTTDDRDPRGHRTREWTWTVATPTSLGVHIRLMNNERKQVLRLYTCMHSVVVNYSARPVHFLARSVSLTLHQLDFHYHFSKSRSSGPDNILAYIRNELISYRKSVGMPSFKLLNDV